MPLPSFQRWFIDGSVHCFHQGHAPMGLLAILVLILCVSTIVIIVLYSLRWLEVSHTMFMIVKYTYTFVCLTFSKPIHVVTNAMEVVKYLNKLVVVTMVSL